MIFTVSGKPDGTSTWIVLKGATFFFVIRSRLTMGAKDKHQELGIDMFK